MEGDKVFNFRQHCCIILILHICFWKHKVSSRKFDFPTKKHLGRKINLLCWVQKRFPALFWKETPQFWVSVYKKIQFFLENAKLSVMEKFTVLKRCLHRVLTITLFKAFYFFGCQNFWENVEYQLEKIPKSCLKNYFRTLEKS